MHKLDDNSRAADPQRFAREEPDARFAQWVEASQLVKVIDPGYVAFVQHLGRLDVDLIRREEAALVDSKRDFAPIIGDSILWVLGAYEVVRTLDQQAVRDPSAVGGQDFGEKVKALKRVFERIRVPLAKAEPAWLHGSDFNYPTPCLHEELGVAWQASDSDFVTRRKLSDALLTAFILMWSFQDAAAAADS